MCGVATGFVIETTGAVVSITNASCAVAAPRTLSARTTSSYRPGSEKVEPPDTGCATPARVRVPLIVTLAPAHAS